MLPNWPTRLSEAAAAQYLSIGRTSFRDKVGSGLYPQPVTEGGRKFWSKKQLDNFVAGQFGLSQSHEIGDDSWADLK